MAEGKKDERAGDPVKILLEDALEKQRNAMMDNFFLDPSMAAQRWHIYIQHGCQHPVQQNDPGGYRWPPTYSIWTRSINSFSFFSFSTAYYL